MNTIYGVITKKERKRLPIVAGMPTNKRNDMKTRKYKNIEIERVFPSGYYKFYSRLDGRFVYFDTLKGAKLYINEFWEQL